MPKDKKDKEKKPQETLENQEETTEEAAAEEAEEATATQPGEAELMAEKLNELNDKHLRLMAEYDNFRKRSQKERENIYPEATAKAVEKFLPVLDNLERAAAFPHGDDDFGKGFDLIYQSFQDVLKALNVEAVGEVGEAFNPDLHNAVMHIEDESLGDNVVAQVLQKGYRIGDRIIRYAMVQTAN